MNTIAQELKNGNRVEYTSEDHRLEAWYDAETGFDKGYRIYFNGTFVCITNNASTFERKLNQLIDEYYLVNNEDFED